MELSAPLARPQTATPSSLTVSVQVAFLQDGAIQMPNTTDHVILEIGCSDMFTLDDERLPYDKSAFLIAFEPLLDKYAVLLARGTPRYHHVGGGDRAVPLGHHHQRGVVLPLAVSAKGGPVRFTVSNVAGCSSMLSLNRSTAWGRHCLSEVEERVVPSITLADALALAGEQPIRMLKIDAQGVDLQMVRETPPALLRSKVASIQMETIASDCHPLYIGQDRCHTTVGYMRSIGYDPAARWWQAESQRGRTDLERCSGWLTVDGQPNSATGTTQECERDFAFSRRRWTDRSGQIVQATRTRRNQQA